MSNIKNSLIGFITFIIANSAIASAVTTPTVTLSGYLKANYGYVHQQDKFKYYQLNTNLSKLRNHHLTNETKVIIDAEDKTDGNIIYGAKVILNADTSSQAEEDYSFRNDYDDISFSSDYRIVQQTYVYVYGDKFGRFVAGSYPGLVNAASVSAECIDVAPVGINGDIRYWINQDTITENFEYFMRIIHKMAPGLYLDNVADSGIVAKNANKISYQTSNFNGLYAAIDYIPDTQISGTIASAINIKKNSYSSIEGDEYNYRIGAYYDVIRGAIVYTKQMNQGFAMKLALIADSGRGKRTNNGGIAGARIHSLRGWQAGGAIKFQAYKIAGAYGDAGRYAGLNTETVKRTKYWNAGIGFEQDRIAMSLAYSDNKRGLVTVDSNNNHTSNPYANSFRTAALGGSYIVSKGAAIESNFTYFKAKDRNTAGRLTLNNKGYQAGLQLRVSL